MSHLNPMLGIEKSAATLPRLLPGERVHAVLIGDDGRAALPGAAATTVLGRPLRGIRRLRSVGRLRSWLRSDAYAGEPLIAAGVWAALPLLVASIGLGAGPIIVWEHSLSEGRGRGALPMRVLDLAAAVLYRRAAGVAVVNPGLAQRMRSRARRVWLTPNLVELPPAATVPARPDSRLIVSVGSLLKVKNHALLIRALPHLPREVRVELFGEGPERATLEALIAALGLHDRVRLRGQVPNAEVTEALRRARLLAHPSLGETFGHVLFEAAAAALPAVVIDAPVMNRFVGSYVPGTVAGHDVASYAEALKTELSRVRGDDEWKAARSGIEAAFGPATVSSAWASVLAAVRAASA
jgi:glycosyltransferase involved in cell wall biosynthesis